MGNTGKSGKQIKEKFIKLFEMKDSAKFSEYIDKICSDDLKESEFSQIIDNLNLKNEFESKPELADLLICSVREINEKEIDGFRSSTL